MNNQHLEDINNYLLTNKSILTDAQKIAINEYIIRDIKKIKHDFYCLKIGSLVKLRNGSMYLITESFFL